MRETGIIRTIDDLGRIAIPRDIRKEIFGTNNAEGIRMEFFIDGNDIVMRKYVGVGSNKNTN